MCVLKKAVCFALLMAMSGIGPLMPAARASGIPVVDGANLAQSVQQLLQMMQQLKELQEQVKTAKEQLDNMKEQLTTAKDTLASLSDPRGLLSLFDSIYSDLDSVTADGILERYGIVSPSSFEGMPSDQAELDEEAIERASEWLAKVEYFEEQTTKRMEELKKAANKETKDLKEAADLQNRILAELAIVGNEQIKAGIGKIGIVEKGIAYFAGYNLRLLIIIQSVAQLTAMYGEAAKDTFVTNLALRIVFAPKENKVAQEISESLGYVTESNVSKSKSSSSGKGGGSRSQSESAVKRAVLWPHELREIGGERAILLVDEVRPVLCRKIRYYKDKNFKPRLLPAASVPLIQLPAPVPADAGAGEASAATPAQSASGGIENAAPRIELVEEIVPITTMEQVDRLNLSNVRFLNKNVIIPKPATLDDDPDSFAEELIDAIFAV